MNRVELLEALPAHAEAVADVYLLSRKHFLPYVAPAHSDSEVRQWIRSELIPGGGVTVAMCDGEVVGLMATSQGNACCWVDQLYLRPGFTSCGIGTQLIRLALSKLSAPVRLFTFQENTGSRRFYERAGFKVVERSDGSGNEEKCPDVLYEWQGTGE